MINAKAIFFTALFVTALSLVLDFVLNNPSKLYDTAIYLLGLLSFWDYRSMAINGQARMITYGSGARRTIDKDRDKTEFEKILASRRTGGFVIMAVAVIFEIYGFYAR